MRRSLFLLIATVVAFVRVFALGFAAVSLGMGDRGGASSALLRVFQLYSLFFVYILYLRYRTSEKRDALQTPSIVLACAAPVLSVLALLALIRHAGDSLPTNLAQAGGSLLAVLVLDILVAGLLAFDALSAAHALHIEASRAAGTARTLETSGTKDTRTAPVSTPQSEPRASPQGAPQDSPLGAAQSSPQGAPQGAPQSAPRSVDIAEDDHHEVH